jgi:YbbR domain-containing protein
MAWHPFRNVGLKLIAVGLGVLLWFTVSGQQAERTIPGVPVVYRNTPQTIEITDQTRFVDIHVRGVDSQLRAVQPRDFEARIDLTGAKPGAQEFPLRIDQVTAPFGLEVTHVDPGSVMAVLDQAGSVTLPVRPDIEGQPASGFIVAEITVDPATVTVVGPMRRLSLASAATTDRVSIEGAAATVTQTVGVGVPDAALRLRDPRSARVVVRVEPARERVFLGVRLAIRHLDAGRRGTVEPSAVAVVLRGAAPVVDRLDVGMVAPHVDVAGLPRGRHEVPVHLDPIGGLTVVSIQPATVIVVIN